MLSRRFGAALSVVALLLGFVASPYTHVHQSAGGVSDAHDHHHSRPATRLHAHVTPHTGHPDAHHPPAESDEDVERKIWSVAVFVFQLAPAAYAPLPSLPVSALAHAVSPRPWVRVSVTQPGAHAPPFNPGSSLRAPPPSGPLAVS